MLDSALTFFQEQLNNYIKVKTGGQTEAAVSFAEVQPPKDLSLQSNAVTQLLIGLEEERIFRSGASYAHTLSNGTKMAANPNLCLNLHVLFISNFTDYVESLRILSLVLKFFRSYRIFERQRFPSLGNDIDKLTTELVNLSFMEQGELWRSLEMPCSPSALYKVRMIAFKDTEMEVRDAASELAEMQSITSQL